MINTQNTEYILNILEKLSIPKHLVSEIEKIVNDNKDLILGRSRTHLILASIYLVCRMNEIPRVIDDFAEVGNVKSKDLARMYRYLLKTDIYHLPIETPLSYIDRISSRLGLKPKTVLFARRIINEAKPFGGKPMLIAGGALYIACVKCGDYVTQKQIARNACCAESAIRDWYKRIITLLEETGVTLND